MTAVPCANCPTPATVLLDDPGANPVAYCDRCLPEHLRPRLAAGQFEAPPDD